MDAYEMLGLSRDASAEQVRAAFRRLAREHHPDQQPAREREVAHVRMQLINEARQRALQGIDQRAAERGQPVRPVVVPLQRTGSPTTGPRQARDSYARSQHLTVVAPPHDDADEHLGRRASWGVTVVPLLLALVAVAGLFTGAPRPVVLALLGLIVVASFMSLWGHGGSDPA